MRHFLRLASLTVFGLLEVSLPAAPRKMLHKMFPAYRTVAAASVPRTPPDLVIVAQDRPQSRLG